ncbi:MAG TPA: HEAT repeat domain-containing protein [Spirochaetota bacterium]|nr:HEAT repeat domain-containing protein [Spirochaetota bacterium]HOD14414.1 HEAT repeat domain-containing protein [Spirochaetota bacterium]HPG50035.1 HEAT repeat domain-containing protein [Spirochaetota bacterium]HPN13306.1 HEAT repeat domain-containing protein [Spirochaetota bacterium]HQL81776.1 HEAT repeat domain-containing protein [Spirochaetota bacterium]
MGFFPPNIKRLDRKNDIPGLLKCLDHRWAWVRYRAFAALSARCGTCGEAADRLRKLLDDPDPWVKTLAVLKFAEQGDPSVAGYMKEIMRDGSRDARIGLLRVLAQRGPTDEPAVIQVIMDGLADRRALVKGHAITAAASTRHRRLMPYVGDLLHENLHGLRIQAARALFEIGGSGSADYLIGLLADREREVRDEARAMLESMDSDMVRRALNDTRFIELIRGMNGTEPVRRETARRIGAESIREGLALLIRACRDRYKGVRIEALRAMAVFRDPVAIDEAARLMKDRYFDVRLEAVRLLGLYDDDRAREAIEPALNDRVRKVREEAKRAHDGMLRFR